VTYIREMNFGQGVDIPKQPQIRGRFIVMLAITLLFAVWHYGLITSASLVLKPIFIGIWDMFCDLASAISDFLKYVTSRRNL